MTEFGICENCGEHKEVMTTLDPFLRDVWNEEVEVIICDQCYQRKADDI